jgi:hypothetical protein
VSAAPAVTEPEIGTALVASERPRTTLLKAVVEPTALIEHHKQLAQFIGQALTEGTDYGKIPGTDKPTLLKPGAERMCTAFGLLAVPEIVEQQVDHNMEIRWVKRKKKWNNAHRNDRTFTWEEEAGTSLGLYRYVVRVRLVSRDSGEVMGEGLGACSTMESKYVDRPRDSENTALKMAQKRALIAAVLGTFGLSDRFTQDMEDVHQGEATNGAEPTHDEGQDPATDKQREFLGKLLKSSVWAQEERTAYAGRGETATKATMKDLIDEVAAEGKRRKEAKGDAAE